MAPCTRILLIEDDASLRRSVQGMLEDAGYDVEPAASATEGIEVLGSDRTIAAVVSEMPPHADPAQVVRRIRQATPDLPVVLIGTAHDTVPALHAALAPVDYIRLPVDADELGRRIRGVTRVLRTPEPSKGTAPTPPAPDRVDRLVGDSVAMQALRTQIARVAAVDSTVLIVGETGTGKELVARLIHQASARRGGPFVTVAAGAAPPDVLAAELFGPPGEGGGTAGRLADADGGTLFLDDVDELPALFQPRLLRFLQERALPGVGGGAGRSVDLRLIAASQRNLTEAIERGAFRPDLFYRLAAVPIELAPLRDHIDDLSALCSHLAARVARRLNKPVPQASPGALEALGRYGFPGNVRELENLLERAMVLGAGAGARHEIRASDFPEYVLRTQAPPATSLPLEGGFARLAELQVDLERDLIERALRRWPHLSNTQIAHRLGTNRRILELRMKHYGLSKRVRPERPAEAPKASQ